MRCLAVVRISFVLNHSSPGVYTFTFLMSLRSPVCWWWCFPLCSPKMKKAKRRLTVDPFEFELGYDYSVESRRRSNQVKAGETLRTSFSTNPTNLQAFIQGAFCLFLLQLFSIFAKYCLVWQNNITLVLSTVIIHSRIWPQYTYCVNPNVHASEHRH